MGNLNLAVILAAVGGACGVSWGDVPLLWKVSVHCRSTNSGGVPTWNLPAGASLLNQAAAIGADGSVAIRAAFSSGPIQDGYFRGVGGVARL